jgi:hypothetical protein
LAPAAARSDTCLPAIGPSSLSAVIVPFSDTSFIGVSYLNNVREFKTVHFRHINIYKQEVVEDYLELCQCQDGAVIGEDLKG